MLYQQLNTPFRGENRVVPSEPGIYSEFCRETKDYVLTANRS